MLLGLCLLPTLGQAGGVPRAERIQQAGTLRVCFWPGYQGIGYRDPRSGQISGLDADLARELARELRVQVQWVDSSFGAFIADLQADRCDVAMMGLTITPERAARIAFSTPYLRTDIQAVTTRKHLRVRSWADIDQPGIRVAVAAGAVHEQVMRARLSRAQLVVIHPPLSRENELAAGRIDVFMTDNPFALRLQASDDSIRVLSAPRPYFPMDYGWAVSRGDGHWLEYLNRFLLLIQGDGRLRRTAEHYRLTRMLILDTPPAKGLR